MIVYNALVVAAVAAMMSGVRMRACRCMCVGVDVSVAAWWRKRSGSSVQTTAAGRTITRIMYTRATCACILFIINFQLDVKLLLSCALSLYTFVDSAERRCARLHLYVCLYLLYVGAHFVYSMQARTVGRARHKLHIANCILYTININLKAMNGDVNGNSE